MKLQGNTVTPSAQTHESRPMASKLEDFGELQTRYQNLPLAERAKALLYDAQPAIILADSIIAQLALNEFAAKALGTIRNSQALIAKLRASEAKNTLSDTSVDFLEAASKKISAWRKTMERLSQGEGIQKSANKEYIANDSPIALAIMSNRSVSNYLSVIQIVLGEMVRIDGQNASHYAKTTAQIRRCATILSDCDTASDITKNIH